MELSQCERNTHQQTPLRVTFADVPSEESIPEQLFKHRRGTETVSKSTEDGTYSSTCSSTRVPSIDDAFDLECGRRSWNSQPKGNFSPLDLCRWRFFGSKIDYKARNPTSTNAIRYDYAPRGVIPWFLVRAIGFCLYAWFIASNHVRLGLSCNAQQTTSKDMSGEYKSSPGPPKVRDASPHEATMFLVWAESLVGIVMGFMLSQGYAGLRSTRACMERVRQTAVTLAYSFIKTTNANNPYGVSREQLQLVVYEMLALITAFPVALVQQLQGNTCELDLVRYCKEVAGVLKTLRDSGARLEDSSYHLGRPWLDREPREKRCTRVDYFFEIFSLRLQLEYSKQRMRVKAPSMSPYQIIFNLRNHFENLIDDGNLDDRRMPIVRENIDLLALAGRESSIYSYKDSGPFGCLWMTDIAIRVVSICLAPQNCRYFAGSAMNNATGPMKQRSSLLAIIMLALISAAALTLLEEMWKMWDPWGYGIDTTAWICGIAKEIDCMLNEYDEDEPSMQVRKHSYMRPPMQSRESLVSGSWSSRQGVPAVAHSV